MIDKRQNNFSFWFPKVKDCGMYIPKTYYMVLPDAQTIQGRMLQEAFFMERQELDLIFIQKFVDCNILPDLTKIGLLGHIFVKNATFSNKFSARGSCNLYGTFDLARAISNINYAALCVGAGGIEEVVVREFIEYDRENTPCIYEGLPLRSEFRVFYDFDKQEPLYTVNYWDYDYTYPNLYEATDRIIFEHERGRLESVFNLQKDNVQNMVAEAMKNGVEGLTGQWSVDVLMDETGKFWLIDMGIAQMSTYWEK